jgi:G3E family GTPase
MVLASPMLFGDDPAAGRRRAVTLLSGFLGSGKTTLLRRELDRAGARAPAVLVNDFGSIRVDDQLLRSGGYEPVVLTGGCACCTRREDLAAALAGLLQDEQRDAAPRRDVVIETSGLSDPGPIAFTIANDPVLRHHYALTRVCVTVDALTGPGSFQRHPVALRQLLAADHLVVTKADLATPEAVEDLAGHLRTLNPSASVSVSADGRLQRTGQPPTGGGVRPRMHAGHPGHPGPEEAHTEGVSTVELVTEEPLDWEAFAVWLSLLVHRRGPDVLRVKALLDVREAGPVALHGVQHIIHRPEHLDRAPFSGSRVVLIVRDIDPGLLERSFRTFLGLR